MDALLGWTSFEHPKTMICVGGDYVLTNMGSVFGLLETKTKKVSSLKLDSACGVVGVNLAAGHKRIPFLAIVDAVLMPNVHVVILPDLQIHCTFPSPRVTLYLDLRFSDNDLLIGLTDRPDFSIRIWSLRTQQLVCEYKTMVPCHPRCLQLTSAPTPTILQFSMLQKKVYLYEMCTQSKQAKLFELSEVALPHEYENVKYSSFSVTEDEKFYVINDYGALSRILAGQSAVQPEWTSPHMIGNVEPMKHDIYGCHQGMLVVTSERILFIRFKNQWNIEWRLENMKVPLWNVISTVYHEIYGANKIGCIYRIEVKDNQPSLVALSTSKFKVKDYCVPNGIKDEIVVLLSMHHTLMFIDVFFPNIHAEFDIPDCECLAVHPFMPYVMVGTTTGSMYIYNFEKVKSPTLVAVLENLDDEVISKIVMVENIIVGICEWGKFYLIEADYKSGTFTHFGTIDEDITGKNHELGVVFSDPERLMVFVGHETIRNMPVARNLWVLEIKRKKSSYSKLVYALQTNYIWFSCTGRQKRAIEFCGIQYNSKIIDLYVLRPNGQLKLEASLMTEHFCSIEGASFSKNLLTYGADGSLMHFRYDKRSPAPYRICKRLQKKFRPRPTKKCDECFNFKYTIFLFVDGLFRVDKLLSVSENLLENHELPVDTTKIYLPKKVEVKKLIVPNKIEVIEYTEDQLAMPDKIRGQLKDLSVEVSELIDYDMSVTGQTSGIFRKFCLNNTWLMMLTEQTRQLLSIERQSLEQCTAEQERIRDWIRSMVMRHSDMIHYKLRAIYSTANFENYAIQKSAEELKKDYDLFRFYASEGRKRNNDDDGSSSNSDALALMEEEEGAGGDTPWNKKRFAIEPGKSAFEHVMSPAFAIQDINSVTINQFCNDAIKFRMILKDALKVEFNKLFYEVQEYKRDVLVNVKATNAALTKIYDNMNIMLRLLNMETFTPPELTVPEWMNDEVLERIMEVDESEVKAINRRKKKAMEAEVKVGRMLLWSVEFWVRALVTMMDGVLEKLWEEEIKKDIPIPEFMLKKSPHDYTLEDQRLLREYEERVRQLEEDRRKYLKILRENELKTMHQKTNHVLKINERITEMAILKLKYDFAISHCILRVLNTNMVQMKRIQIRQTINEERKDIERLHDYSTKYMNLSENWELALQDVRTKLEAALAKDKLVEKQFRGHFLGSVPSHLSNDLLKLYKRRPKVTHGAFNSMIMCFEVAMAVGNKSATYSLPLPKEGLDFLAHIDSIDNPSNCPAQLEAKHWDGFCKLRRLRLESDLRVRGIQLHLAELTNDKAWFNKEINANKAMHNEKYQKLNDQVDFYVESVQNMSLQITLSLGQVEVRTKGSAAVLKDTVLMHVDDINAVNALIQEAGRRKLRAMQRVAAFRRQVIYKEWEHKMVSANISYLKYMLNVIEKCKVSKEFLDILRKWEKVKKNREYMQGIGVIERVVAQKLAAYRKNLERLIEKIESVKVEIDELRADNRRVDRKIDAVKVQVTMASLQRDELMEEKRKRELHERMLKIRTQRQLMDTVRRDYAHILELNTILELQRLRTYPTLGPPIPDCPPLKEYENVSS